MTPADPTQDRTSVPLGRLDPESGAWLSALTCVGAEWEAAQARLYAMLVRIARAEVRRRGPRVQITGPELDDLVYQCDCGRRAGMAGLAAA
jgi:RNA polymerase sigma-70 factor (ECF subfamily)